MTEGEIIAVLRRHKVEYGFCKCRGWMWQHSGGISHEEHLAGALIAAGIVTTTNRQPDD